MSIDVFTLREDFAAYAAKMGPAIQGQGGDAKTYKVCAVGVRDFGLSEADVLAALVAWNGACVPPWDQRDLLVKIRNAAKYARGVQGSKVRVVGEARQGAFDAVEEAVEKLILAICEPLDPEQVARDYARLGKRVEPTLALAKLVRQEAITWLLREVVDLYDWKRPPREKKADPRKIPPKARPAAVLLAVEAFLKMEKVEEGVDRVTLIMEQAAREHWACNGGTPADRLEVRLDERTIDRVSTPAARDGHARARPALEGSGEHDRALRVSPAVHFASDIVKTKRPAKGDQEKTEQKTVTAWPSAGGVNARAQLPEDPEAILLRAESFALVRATLSPVEQAVFDEPFSDSPEDVAARVGTTWKTVKTIRQRIRRKAEAWAARQAKSDETI